MRDATAARSVTRKFVLPLVLGAALVAIWHLSVVWTHTKVFPSPVAVVRGMRSLAREGLLARDVVDSLRRVAVGYLAAAFTAIPLGLWMGWRPRVAATLNPLLQLMRPISPIAWIPLAIVLFGVSDLAAMFLIYLSAFFPLAFTTSNAVRAIPVVYIRAGRNFGLGPLRLASNVVLPAIVPDLLTALRVALGIAWLVVVAAEMVAVESGLGYLILDARNAGKRYDLVVAGMVLIGIIGMLLDAMLRLVQRLKMFQWGTRAA